MKFVLYVLVFIRVGKEYSFLGMLIGLQFVNHKMLANQLCCLWFHNKIHPSLVTSSLKKSQLHK